MTTETPLLELIFDRLATDQTDSRTAELVLAALGADGELEATLGGTNATLAIDPAPPESAGHLFLSAVTVAGFRGVGPARTLPIRPGPGLTLVVGRNGSGKSSFAEAIELLLTGDSARWADRSSVWRTGWRNLHQPDPCGIEAELHVDGDTTPMRLHRDWAPGAALTEATGSDLADLRRPMELYRPFLTAAEVGRLVTGTPSALFDAIDAILGLDALNTADQRLHAAIKPLDAAAKQVRTDRARLKETLAGIDDDRARRAAAALADPEAVAAILEEPLSGELIDHHRQWATLSLPDLADVAALAEELRELSAQARTAGDTTATVRLAELLRLAVDHHDATGASSCPVCHVGTLDQAWRASAAATLDELRDTALGAQRATTRRNDLVRRARAVTAVSLPPDPSVAAAVATLRAAPSAGEDLAVHLLTHYPALVAAAEVVRAAAAAWLEERDTGWQQILPDLRRWVSAAREVPQQAGELASLKAARSWLKDAAIALRNQRLAPFAAHAQRIWEELRQESNVQLGTMSLAGTATRRRIEFPISVDGADSGAALGVMSQGEMQALGLAMFLPRACADESPFRFVVIDDPVQSMDPSKVDGLARVLATIATDRQVIVFTHDPRLPEAVRRLEIDAVTLQVLRGERSVVSVEPASDPALRYLDDARALACSAEVDADVRTPVVAELCRSALEYACQRVVWRVRTARGERHASIEETLQHAQKTTTLFALALFDDPDRGGDVLRHLRNAYGGWAVNAYDLSRKAVHGNHPVPDLPGFVRDTRRLAEALR
ncbi:AAA family ATPase [Dactylosporangium sp. CA-152071]|uniref:AAA family ATPase n=1 Tax=Dactylosporangium sp. CA-152071 TaxID=3239933 RepID=UPI003D8C2206